MKRNLPWSEISTSKQVWQGEIFCTTPLSLLSTGMNPYPDLTVVFIWQTKHFSWASVFFLIPVQDTPALCVHTALFLIQLTGWHYTERGKYIFCVMSAYELYIIFPSRKLYQNHPWRLNVPTLILSVPGMKWFYGKKTQLKNEIS